MRLWMLPAPTGTVSTGAKQLILIGFDLASETTVVVDFPVDYLRRYLWDTD